MTLSRRRMTPLRRRMIDDMTLRILGGRAESHARCRSNYRLMNGSVDFIR